MSLLGHHNLPVALCSEAHLGTELCSEPAVSVAGIAGRFRASAATAAMAGHCCSSARHAPCWAVAERCCVPLLDREHRYGWRKKKQETETLPAEKREPGPSSGFHLACLRICRLLLLSACCKPAWTGAQFVLFQPRDSSIF